MKKVELQPSMKLLPPPEGHCRICAVKHEPAMPHNAQSLFYQMRFKMRYGRDGTWADAAAHCTNEMRAYWAKELAIKGVWTQLPEGVAVIAEPIDSQEPAVETTEFEELLDEYVEHLTSEFAPTRMDKIAAARAMVVKAYSQLSGWYKLLEAAADQLKKDVLLAAEELETDWADLEKHGLTAERLDRIKQYLKDTGQESA